MLNGLSNGEKWRKQSWTRGFFIQALGDLIICSTETELDRGTYSSWDVCKSYLTATDWKKV